MRIFKLNPFQGIFAELGSIRVLLTGILEEVSALNKTQKGMVADVKVLNQIASETCSGVASYGNSLSRFLREQRTINEIEGARNNEIREEQGQKPTPHDLLF